MGKTLVTLLLQKLENQLQVHGGYLAGLDTLLVPKNGKKMSGVQLWKDHSGNANRGERLTGHHWGILGLISFEPTSHRKRVLGDKNEANFWETQPV